LAFLGFGYMSPAWGSVVGMCANVLACSTWGRAYRIRGLSLRHWKSVTRFGLQQTFGDVMNRLGFYAPDFVIGRVLGFADVGIYSRGYGLINLFRTRVMGAIGAVAFPAFAHKHRTSEGARGLYLKSVTFVTGISLPFAAFACLMAYPIIRIMFGSQWDGAVPILHLLAAAAFVGMLAPQFGQLLTAMGKVGVSTATGTAVQIMRFAVIIPAAFWSLEAVAASQILTAGFAVVIKYALLRKYAGVSTLESLRALSPSLGLTAAAMIIPVLIYALMPFSEAGLWLPLALSCLGAGIGWLVGAWALKHPLWLELTDVLNRFRQRRAAQA
jgi:O-antigen/teichoic acid export membrane protein